MRQSELVFVEILRNGESTENYERNAINMEEYLACGSASGFNIFCPSPRLRSDFGMFLQDYSLLPHLIILQNLTLAPIRRKQLNRAPADAKARSLLARVGLAYKADCYPFELSRGQPQRVVIVRALAMRPKAILFDELMSALDPETIGGVLDVMRLLAQDGVTMIVAKWGLPRRLLTTLFSWRTSSSWNKARPSRLRIRRFLDSIQRFGPPR